MFIAFVFSLGKAPPFLFLLFFSKTAIETPLYLPNTRYAIQRSLVLLDFWKKKTNNKTQKKRRLLCFEPQHFWLKTFDSKILPHFRVRPLLHTLLRLKCNNSFFCKFSPHIFVLYKHSTHNFIIMPRHLVESVSRATAAASLTE